jgi:cellulose biosynthesis protein BcsQ
LVDLLERKLIFVTGKGGVGKSTVAAALAWLAAARGKRTLVCEVDAKGNLADFFETAPTRFKERPPRASRRSSRSASCAGRSKSATTTSWW